MIIGKNVILEEIDPKNIEQMRQWRNDPEIRKYFREYKDISKDMQERWYRERGNNTNPAHVYFQIMAREGKNKKLIGCCGLHYIDWRIRSAEFGVYLGGQGTRGKGYGKEALIMLFDYGFDELNLHRIWCEVYENNKAIGLYRKLGFKDEGRLRDVQYTGGKYIDSYILSVLETEWVG